MIKQNDLDDILVQMNVISEEKIKNLRKEYDSRKIEFSFNKFLIDVKEITHEQLRVALLIQKSNIG